MKQVFKNSLIRFLSIVLVFAVCSVSVSALSPTETHTCPVELRWIQGKNEADCLRVSLRSTYTDVRQYTVAFYQEQSDVMICEQPWRRPTASIFILQCQKTAIG